MAVAELIEQTISQHIAQPKVLSFAPSKKDEVTGRFIASNRVYNFVLDRKGVSYSPAGRQDSLVFSALFLERLDAVKRPKIGNDKCNAGKSYQCGKTCISNRWNCRKGVKDVNDARRIASILASTNERLKASVKVSDKAQARGRALFEARGKREANGKPERAKIESLKVKYTPAKYAKGKMAVKDDLAERFGGKWSNRESAFIISKAGIEKMEAHLRVKSKPLHERTLKEEIDNNFTAKRILDQIAKVKRDYDPEDWNEALKYKGLDKDIQFVNNRKQEHKKAVEEALANGQTVPDAVLNDYPDLLKRNNYAKSENLRKKNKLQAIQEFRDEVKNDPYFAYGQEKLEAEEKELKSKSFDDYRASLPRFSIDGRAGKVSVDMSRYLDFSPPFTKENSEKIGRVHGFDFDDFNRNTFEKFNGQLGSDLGKRLFQEVYAGTFEWDDKTRGVKQNNSEFDNLSDRDITKEDEKMLMDKINEARKAKIEDIYKTFQAKAKQGKLTLNDMIFADAFYNNEEWNDRDRKNIPNRYRDRISTFDKLHQEKDAFFEKIKKDAKKDPSVLDSLLRKYGTSVEEVKKNGQTPKLINTIFLGEYVNQGKSSLTNK